MASTRPPPFWDTYSKLDMGGGAGDIHDEIDEAPGQILRISNVLSAQNLPGWSKVDDRYPPGSGEKAWSREARTPIFEIFSGLESRWLSLQAQGGLWIVEEDKGRGWRRMNSNSANAPRAAHQTAVEQISIWPLPHGPCARRDGEMVVTDRR